jgi:hypothetical protein
MHAKGIHDCAGDDGSVVACRRREWQRNLQAARHMSRLQEEEDGTEHPSAPLEEPKDASSIW